MVDGFCARHRRRQSRHQSSTDSCYLANTAVIGSTTASPRIISAPAESPEGPERTRWLHLLSVAIGVAAVATAHVWVAQTSAYSHSTTGAGVLPHPAGGHPPRAAGRTGGASEAPPLPTHVVVTSLSHHPEAAFPCGTRTSCTGSQASNRPAAPSHCPPPTRHLLVQVRASRWHRYVDAMQAHAYERRSALGR